MGYGADAFSIASQIALAGAFALLIWRMVTMFDNRAPAQALQRGWTAGVAMFALGLLVERFYYIAARVLRPYGYNLWEEHPAPEVLSVVVLMSIYAMKVPLILSLYPRRRAYTQIAAEIGGLSALWFACVGIFY